MTELDKRPGRSTTPAWLVVLDRELRDIWVSGRGLPLMLAYTLMLSFTSYLVATNQAMNFLEVRESVSLTLKVAVAVSVLLVVLASADAISGERERETLESLLLSPVGRSALVVGKGAAALSLWLAAMALSCPYLWFLGRGVAVVGKAVVGGLVVGALLALFLAGLGMLVSIFSVSNRVSVSVSLFLLVALYAPAQLATVGLQPSVGDVLQRIDPFTSGLSYLDKVIIDGHSPGQDLGLMISPVIAAVVFSALALVASSRIALSPWERS
ncbi:MAG TPA: ABC transporter permease subunit [Nocardioides sp.]|jgi:ABC-2 type transport system permease protein